jgi:hypothetical protein
VDPDGNWIHLVVGGVIGGIVNLVSGTIQGRIHNFGDAFKFFGLGALQGTLGAAIIYGGFGLGAAAKSLQAGYLSTTTFFGPKAIGQLASGIASSAMPSIPFGRNLSISPIVGFGSHGFSAGLSARVQSGNFSFGVGFNAASGNASFSYGGGWYDGQTGFSYFRNHFSGQYSQVTGTIGFRAGPISGSWENDMFAFGKGGQYDRWRTNGMGLGYTFRDRSTAFVGSRFMTGMDDGGEYSADRPIYNEIEGSKAPREGLFYGSFYNRQGIGISAGVDWEHGMHKVQNGLHDLLRSLGYNDWYFPNLGRPVGGFYRYGNRNPFTYFH